MSNLIERIKDRIEKEITQYYLMSIDDLVKISDVERVIDEESATGSKSEIVRSAEDIAKLMNEMLTKIMHCSFCPCYSKCRRNGKSCEEEIIDWLTKKEV